MVLPSTVQTNWFLNRSWRQRRYRVFLRIASSYALSLQKRLHTSSTRQIWLLYLSKKNNYLLPRKTFNFGQNQSKYQISRLPLEHATYIWIFTSEPHKRIKHVPHVWLFDDHRECCSILLLAPCPSIFRLHIKTDIVSQLQGAICRDLTQKMKLKVTFPFLLLIIRHILIWRKPAGWFYFLLLFYSHSHCHPAHPTPPSSPTYKSIAHPPPTLY